MKRAISSWIMAVVFLGVSSLAFADEPVTPDKAKEHVGNETTVQGTVSEVHFSPSGGVQINFGPKFPNQDFTAFIPPSAAKDFEHDYLEKLKDQTLSVTGKVKLYKEKPQIVVTKRDQLKP